jgi:hypothetical protein
MSCSEVRTIGWQHGRSRRGLRVALAQATTPSGRMSRAVGPRLLRTGLAMYRIRPAHPCATCSSLQSMVKSSATPVPAWSSSRTGALLRPWHKTTPSRQRRHQPGPARGRGNRVLRLTSHGEHRSWFSYPGEWTPPTMVRRSSSGTRSLCIAQAAAPAPTRPWPRTSASAARRCGPGKNGGQDPTRR